MTYPPISDIIVTDWRIFFMDTKKRRMQTHDIVRKFNGEVGMIIDYGHIKNPAIVIYREGYDFLDEIRDEIKQVARPKESWMYAPDHWDDDRVWDECMIIDTRTRYMTISELKDNDDVHATLGYTLIIEED